MNHSERFPNFVFPVAYIVKKCCKDVNSINGLNILSPQNFFSKMGGSKILTFLLKRKGTQLYIFIVNKDVFLEIYLCKNDCQTIFKLNRFDTVLLQFFQVLFDLN